MPLGSHPNNNNNDNADDYKKEKVNILQQSLYQTIPNYCQKKEIVNTGNISGKFTVLCPVTTEIRTHKLS